MHRESIERVSVEASEALRDLHRFVREAGLYLLIVVLGSGGAFIFQNLIAVDEWWSYSDKGGWQTTGPISMGRPTFAFLSWLAQDAFPLHPFDTVLFYSSLVLFVFIVFRRWSESSWVRLLILSLFLTSPFLVEHLLFTVNQIPLSFAFVLLSYWFLSISVVSDAESEGLPYAVVFSGALAAALAVTIRNELIFVISAAASIELSRAILQGSPKIGRRIGVVLSSLTITVILSALIILVSIALAGTGFRQSGNNGTDKLVRTPEQFLMVSKRFLEYWQYFLFRQQYLVPFVIKALVWVVVAVAVLESIVASDYRRTMVLFFAGILLSALPLSLGLVSTGFPYLYAGVFPLAFFACFVACVAITARPGVPGARLVACVASALIIAISAASLSAAQVRLSNLNRRDISTITQMLGAIRATGVVDWKIALLGSYTERTKERWTGNRERCSVFQCTQALGPLLSLTVAETAPAARVFELTQTEVDSLKPELDRLPEGSATLVRIDQRRFVILLK